MTQGDDATQGSGWNAHAYDRSFGFVSQHGKSALELLNPQPGERILDLGCGTGELTSQIADAGADVEGIDADENMVAVARQRRPDLVFRRADGHTFRVDEGFDAVFSNAALHWMLRPAAVVDRVWERCGPVVVLWRRWAARAMSNPLLMACRRHELSWDLRQCRRRRGSSRPSVCTAVFWKRAAFM